MGSAARGRRARPVQTPRTGAWSRLASSRLSEPKRMPTAASDRLQGSEPPVSPRPGPTQGLPARFISPSSATTAPTRPPKPTWRPWSKVGTPLSSSPPATTTTRTAKRRPSTRTSASTTPSSSATTGVAIGKGGTTNRFFPSPGNHDWVAGLGAYVEYFTLPGNERYYDVDLGLVHLYVLDSDLHEPDGTTADSVQAKWSEGPPRFDRRLATTSSTFITRPTLPLATVLRFT